MKKITEAFTPEQQELLKNVYIIINSSAMVPLVEGNEPTRENLQVIAKGFEDKEAVVLKAEDFQYYSEDEHDFKYYTGDFEDYVFRTCVPEEVATILDAVITKM